jgi:N-methylhydantoinase A/oxoprolinase/acetone carboxylase beta subunit
MLLGIDVGGTHTDAVLLRIEGNAFSVVASVKTATHPDDVVSSVKAALQAVFASNGPAAVSRFTLSTTLTTNALAQGRFDSTHLALIPGPGMSLDSWTDGLPVSVLSGYMDHRGRETVLLRDEELAALAAELAEKGVTHLAVAGKFATRNPEQERRAGEFFSVRGGMESVSCSYALSGMLNFPRRAVTAFFNAAIRSLHGSFVDAVLAVSGKTGGSEPFLLMAHGGSVPIKASRNVCVEAANSGPAASVLGILALEGAKFCRDEAVLFCDIGGSTTDLALLAGGSPVTAREGITLGGRRTSVPGIATWSVPIGGDSLITIAEEGKIDLKAERQGPCYAMGGPVPTLTDALNVLGYASFGDVAASRAALREIAAGMHERTGIATGAEDVARLATLTAGKRIYDEAVRFIENVNTRPVYTVAQLLEGAVVSPAVICSVGGAGESMAPVLENAFSLPVTVPGYAPFANAIGAALSQVSAFASLYADTARQTAYLLPKGERFAITPAYTQKDAEATVIAYLEREGAALDTSGKAPLVEIVESDAFAMHDERGGRLGRTIRVTARLKPGLVTDMV